MRRSKKKGIYDYLDSIKVLESGTDEQIILAQKIYWKNYKATWRRNKRKNEKELVTSWAKDELADLSNAAKKHNLSKTRFIKSACLAYIDKRYIVPDQMEVRRIAQLLSITYNSIREMMDENALQLQPGKIILEKMFDLERQVLVSLHNPKTIEQLITEMVKASPQTKSHLFHLLESLP